MRLSRIVGRSLINGPAPPGMMLVAHGRHRGHPAEIEAALAAKMRAFGYATSIEGRDLLQAGVREIILSLEEQPRADRALISRCITLLRTIHLTMCMPSGRRERSDPLFVIGADQSGRKFPDLWGSFRRCG